MFRRKRNRHKLCREEIDVTEELKTVRLLLQIYIYMCVNTWAHTLIRIKRC